MTVPGAAAALQAIAQALTALAAAQKALGE